MKCPHCLTAYHSHMRTTFLGDDRVDSWAVGFENCPECGKLIVKLIRGSGGDSTESPFRAYEEGRFVLPKAAARPPAPPEVPAPYRDDYAEACLVLPDSPKAAAALGRRCLQGLLRDVVKVRHGDLANEIQQVLDEQRLPPYLLKSIDAVRNVGNFAAHPTESKSTGEILPVEPGEAEWTVDFLESLFEHLFVQPKQVERKTEKLNKKLAEAGKPPMKR
jgi:hypothetical protein